MAVLDGIAASHSEEERILIDTPSRSIAHSEGASGSKEGSGSEEAFASPNANAPATSVQCSGSYKADSADSTPTLYTVVPTSVAN